MEDETRRDPGDRDPAGAERRRRGRNLALLVALLALALLFYAITFVKMGKG